MAEDAPSLLHTLVVVEGEDRGRRWTIPAGGAVIGHGLGADIIVADPRTAPVHARLEWTAPAAGEAPRVELVDLGSVYGTRVNGTPVAGRVLLAEHDRLQIGSTMLAFTMQDGGELLREREELERASTDPVTGLSNAHAFGSLLAREFSRARRYATPLSIVVLELDRFAAVEATHGAPAADAVVAHIGRVLRDSLRRSDLAARGGPERFHLALAATSAPGAKLVADRIRRAIAAFPAAVGERSIPVTASAGVATLAEGHGSEAALLESASHACFRAKAAGMDRVVVAGEAEPGER